MLNANSILSSTVPGSSSARPAPSALKSALPVPEHRTSINASGFRTTRAFPHTFVVKCIEQVRERRAQHAGLACTLASHELVDHLHEASLGELALQIQRPTASAAQHNSQVREHRIRTL